MVRYLVDENGTVVFIRDSGNAGRRLGQQSQRPSRPQFKCPRCNSTVRQSRLERHLKKVHAASENDIAALVRNFPVSHTQVTPSHAGDRTNTTGSSSRPSAFASSAATDGQDGSKHIGQFARENGRFGSMPKYDDYSEEGSAE